MKITRNTQARKAILALINESAVALSQPSIQVELNGLCDRVTIYRVLDRLVEEGLIHKIVNVNGVVNYAACVGCETDANHEHKHTHAHHHVHFSCKVCNELTCLDQVVPDFKLPTDFVLEETFFTISGTCASCARKKA